MDTEVPLVVWMYMLAGNGGVGVIPWYLLLVLGLLVGFGGLLAGYLASSTRGGRARREDGTKALVAIGISTIACALLVAWAWLEYRTSPVDGYEVSTILLALFFGPLVGVVFPVLGGLAGLHRRDRGETKDAWINAGLVASGIMTLGLVGLVLSRQSRKPANGSDEHRVDEEPEFEIELASGEEIEAEEREYIGNILELGDTTAREVMTPRTDVVALDVSWEQIRIFAEVAESRFSRFPVYQDRIDNVVGILHLRDLLEFLARGEAIDQLVLKEVVRDPYFVPGGRKADDVLRDLQLQKSHMAVVLDEFGGMAGILTIEDLLEEIVGEIQDEHDDESKLVHQREDGSWVIDAQLTLDHFAAVVGVELDDEDGDVDTLGGFIATHFGRIPDARESFAHEGLRFTVLSVEKNRILRVGVQRHAS